MKLIVLNSKEDVCHDLLYFTNAVRGHERHDSYTSKRTSTRAKNFDFDNDTSENIFSYPHISYISNERLQGEEQLYSKN